MTFNKKLFTGTGAGIIASTFVHAALAGTLYYGFIIHKPAEIVAELDLSLAPLIRIAANPDGGYSVQSKSAWTMPNKHNLPSNQPNTILETADAELKDENQHGSNWGSGSEKGVGGFIPASETSRKPRWIKNLINSSDYPTIARKEGKDGRVVLTVFIDANGIVKDAKISEGSYSALNDVALTKIKEAVFSPAYNKEEKPVACRVMIPIRFELSD